MIPLRDLILVKPCPADEVTEGGLFIPSNAQERSSKAIVVKTGKGLKGVEMEAKQGDMIYHIKGAGSEFIVDGEPHYLIRQIDILSYVTNN